MAPLEPRFLKRLLFDFLRPISSEGDNPYLITLEENKLWIYLKNLSPAYFKNPDIWRAQLPIRDVFNDCKDSPYPFVLLGYDDENDVYATWSPNVTKQRLNEAESVSFYSRLSLQQEAGENSEILEMELNNNGKVVCFPRSVVAEVINSLQSYFPDSGEYVPTGSKRRVDANMSYRTFVDTHNVIPFFNYIVDKGYSEKTATNYSNGIKRLITKGLLSKYRHLFLRYDYISEYISAFDEFFAKEDVHQADESSHKILSNAFKNYVEFLSIEDNDSGNSDTQDFNISDNQANESKDWETPFIDAQGKLTRIANPELLAQLRPLLDSEYKSTVAALNIVKSFYGERFPESIMELTDWMRIIKNIDWETSTPNGLPSSPNQVRLPETPQYRKEFILDVTLSDGTHFRNPNNTQTFLEVIEYFGADYIIDMGIMVNGRNLISKEFIHPRLKQLPSGFFVDVNYKTDKKAEILRNIASEFGETISIELIPFGNDSQVNREKPKNQPPSGSDATSENSSRQKLKVTFDDGTTCFFPKVVHTLIETIRHIGLEKVYNLDICSGGPHKLLVKDSESPNNRKYIRIDDGWYIHVNTRTDRKYMILCEIVRKLNLDYNVELLDAFDKTPAAQIIISSEENNNTSSRDKIQVTFPNGKVICPINVADALIEVIKFAGVAAVDALGLTAHNSNNGQLLIVKEVNPKYKVSTKPLSDGYFVFTNSSTLNKYSVMQKINDTLNLGLKIILLQGANKKTH